MLTKPKAADHIYGMTHEEFNDIDELADQSANYFDWQCVLEEVDQKRVLRSICTCALLLGRLTNSTGPVYEQSDRLGNAAHNADIGALKEWILDDPWPDENLDEDNRIAAIQRLARALAKRFDEHHVVPWR